MSWIKIEEGCQMPEIGKDVWAWVVGVPHYVKYCNDGSFWMGILFVPHGTVSAWWNGDGKPMVPFEKWVKKEKSTEQLRIEQEMFQIRTFSLLQMLIFHITYFMGMSKIHPIYKSALVNLRNASNRFLSLKSDLPDKKRNLLNLMLTDERMHEMSLIFDALMELENLEEVRIDVERVRDEAKAAAQLVNH